MEQFAADDARVLVVDTAGKLDGAPSGQYDGVVVEGSAGNVEFRDVLRVLRPSGRCVVRTGVKSSALIFAGFVNVAQQDGMVTGEKPSWTAGESASLPLGDADLIDEDALLDHEAQETRVPSAAARESECGPTKRKACKNCTCGYAETLGAAQAAEQAPPVGGCGSCGLGDAFRCSTCPYLGQPAFKPGDKVKLVL
ncbi:Anamorsin like protein [Plasmodiophora brassicae]